MGYRYLDDFRRGISVFAIFSYGIAVLGTPQCPPPFPVQGCPLRFSFLRKLTSWSTEDTADDEIFLQLHLCRVHFKILTVKTEAPRYLEPRADSNQNSNSPGFP